MDLSHQNRVSGLYHRAICGTETPIDKGNINSVAYHTVSQMLADVEYTGINFKGRRNGGEGGVGWNCLGIHAPGNQK